MNTLHIRGGTVLRRAGDGYEPVEADVVVEGRTITAVVDRRTGPATTVGTDEGVDVVDARGGLVLPGLANLHTHSYANLFRGRFDRLPLEPWMPYATATTLGRTRREGFVSAMLGGVESLRAGTTLVLDHLGGTMESRLGALDAYEQLGLRVAFSPMVSDLPLHTTVALPDGVTLDRADDGARPATPSVAEIVDEMTQLLDGWHDPDGRVHVLPGPSGPQRCSEALLTACAELAERFVTGVHTHLLESRTQAAGARATPDGSLVVLLDRLGLLDEGFSGAHGVWCSPEELELLGQRGATLVHNPWSNLTLGSGRASIRDWHDAGVVRALGTDGASCGGNLSMFRAMGLAAVLDRPSVADPSQWPTVDEVLAMATEGAARASGWDGRLGRVEPGQLADLVVLDLEPMTYPAPEGLVGQLVHGETGGAVRDVVVDGRRVLIDGELPGVDLAELGAEARELSARIEERNAPLMRSADAQRDALLAAAKRHHPFDPTR